MRKFFLLVFVMVIWALMAIPVASMQSEPLYGLTASLCRANNLYAVTVSNIGTGPIQVGYALVWAPGESPVIVDLGVIGAGQSTIFGVEPHVENDAIQFFVYLDGTWQSHSLYRRLSPVEVPECGTQPEFSHTSTPGPGPELFMPIGPDDVVVQFTANTPLYWYPADWAATKYKVAAGQTAWMIGAESGFAKMVWGASIVWVPLNAVGPLR